MYQKQESHLKNKSFALVPTRIKGLSDKVSYSNSSAFSRIQIMMCSSEAGRVGVRAGMKLSEAKAICANLLWREYDHHIGLKYQTTLVKELIDCSPRIVAREPGIFLLDAEGRKHLGGENKLCRDILRLASKCGFVHGQVGVADSAFGALVATRFKNRRWFVVETGSDERFLSPLPISHLPMSEELQNLLLNLGIRSMGQLAQLSVARVLERFGEEGRKAHELSRGFDLSQPQMPVHEKQFSYRVEMGGPIEALNQTLFVMKSMLDKLTQALSTEGLRADELTVSFFNDEDKFDERPIKLINSSNHAKFLLEVLRLSLESQPLCREFTGLAICASRFSKEQWDQSSISQLNQRDEDISPESLNLLLQRFITRLGDDALVKPMTNDHYMHEKAGFWQPIIQLKNSHTDFADVSSQPKKETGNIDQQTAVEPVNSTEMDLVTIAVDSEYIKESTGESGLVANLVFKKNSVPVPVMIEFNNTQPAAVRYHGRWHYIKKLTVPECMSGDWWEKPVRRSYYTALLDSTNETGKDKDKDNDKDYDKDYMDYPSVMSLFHDHNSQSWFVDGIYD